MARVFRVRLAALAVVGALAGVLMAGAWPAGEAMARRAGDGPAVGTTTAPAQADGVRAVELPFAPGVVAVSEDGTRLAIAIEGQRNHQTRQTEPARLAAIDLESGEVLFDERLESIAPGPMVLTHGTVVMAHAGAAALHVRPLGGEPRTLFTPERVRALGVFGDRLYVDMNGPMMALALPGLGSLPEMPALGRAARDRDRRWPVAFEGGWRTEAAVLDAGLERVLMVLDADVRRGYRVGWRGDLRGTIDGGSVRWGLVGHSHAIVTTGGQQLAGLPWRSEDTGDAFYCSRLPLVAQLAQRRVRDEDRERTEHSLRLTSMTTLASADLALPIDPGVRYSLGVRDERIFETPGGLLAIVGDRAVRIPDSALAERFGRADLRAPLHFPAAQPAVVVPAGSPATLTYEASGGVEPITYAIEDSPWATMDAATGELTIHPQPLEADRNNTTVAVANELFQRLQPRWDPTSNDPSALPERADWSAVLGDRRERLSAMLGVEVRGLPVGLHLLVRARDATGREVVLPHQVILEVPIERLDAEYARGRAERIAQHEARQQERSVLAEMRRLREENESLKEELGRLRTQLEVLKETLKEVLAGRDGGGGGGAEDPK